MRVNYYLLSLIAIYALLVLIFVNLSESSEADAYTGGGAQHVIGKFAKGVLMVAPLAIFLI